MTHALAHAATDTRYIMTQNPPVIFFTATDAQSVCTQSVQSQHADFAVR